MIMYFLHFKYIVNYLEIQVIKKQYCYSSYLKIKKNIGKLINGVIVLKN